MYLTLGVGAGGFMFPDTIIKPWNNSDPKCQLNFYKNKTVWYPSWESGLIVDYIKVWVL